MMISWFFWECAWGVAPPVSVSVCFSCPMIAVRLPDYHLQRVPVAAADLRNLSYRASDPRMRVHAGTHDRARANVSATQHLHIEKHFAHAAMRNALSSAGNTSI